MFVSKQIKRMGTLEKIKKFIISQDDEDFSTLEKDIVFYVDWREFDSDIIGYCEEIIQTKKLEAKIDKDNLIINYLGNEYVSEIIDRDTTIIKLNEILKPTYEIRFCTFSWPADTLAFLPLLREDWLKLEKDLGGSLVQKSFEKIEFGSKMFNKDFDIEIDDNIKIDLDF